MKMLYMAAPYTSPSAEVRAERREYCDIFAARLTDFGAVFSPITHGTRLERHLPEDLAQHHDFWMRQCFSVLRRADELVLLPLRGWRDSEGVRMEIEFARHADISVTLIQMRGEGGPLEKLSLQDVRWLQINNTYFLG